MNDERQRPRPDTSKNGLMKKTELDVSDEKIKKRGREVLSRLGQKKKDKPNQ